jgi:hypothetical protein
MGHHVVSQFVWDWEKPGADFTHKRVLPDCRQSQLAILLQLESFSPASGGVGHQGADTVGFK